MFVSVTPRKPKTILRTILLPAVLLALLLISTPTRAADPVADIDAQYQIVLETLRHPPASGVLVTESPPAIHRRHRRRAAAGDIINTYYGEKITTLANLSEHVADVMGAQAPMEDVQNKVILQLRRGKEQPGQSRPPARNPWAFA